MLIEQYLSMATNGPFKLSQQVYSKPKSALKAATRSIVINSIIAEEVELDDKVVVLNSNLIRKMHVGSNCFLNGVLYYDVISTATASTGAVLNVIIPSNMVVQGFIVHSEELNSSAIQTKRAMSESEDLKSAQQSVYGIMIWGVNDKLRVPLENKLMAEWREEPTFCGQKWSTFLYRTGIRADDLWSASTVCNINCVVFGLGLC